MKFWRKGLTLAEVIVALGILTAAVLAIIAGFIGALELNARSLEMAVATQVARDFLERVKEQGYEVVPEGTFEFDGRANQPPNAQGFPPAPYPSIVENERTHFLKVKVDTKGASLKVVVVEVEWTEKRRVTLETYLYPGTS